MIATGTEQTRDGRGGFALVEVMIALLMIALIAAVGMPGLVRPTGPGALRIAAMNVTVLLRNARNAALADGRAVAAKAAGDTVRSAGDAVAMPPNAIVGPPGATIRFMSDGRASGGPFVLSLNGGGGFAISVSPESGAINVSAR